MFGDLKRRQLSVQDQIAKRIGCVALLQNVKDQMKGVGEDDCGEEVEWDES